MATDMTEWQDCRPEIARFWERWPSFRSRAERARHGELDDLGRQLDTAVAFIDPRLCWELGKATSGWLLVVTANGDPEVRSTAERWLQAAPAPDPGWRFYCFRPADPGALSGKLQLGGRAVDLADIRFRIDRDFEQARIHVTVCHPEFAALDEDARLQAVFMALDRTLGEDQVLRWVGDIDTSASSGTGAVPADLVAEVANLAKAYAAPKSVTLTDVAADGLPVVTRTTVPIRPIDFPLYDQHVAISVGYASAGSDGLPGLSTLTRLQQFEDALMAQADGQAALTGHETHDHRRVLHLYADPVSDTAERLEGSLPAWLEGPVNVKVTLDPSWDEISHFLT
jgi:Family of unknown function (DUF695)